MTNLHILQDVVPKNYYTYWTYRGYTRRWYKSLSIHQLNMVYLDVGIDLIWGHQRWNIESHSLTQFTLVLDHSTYVDVYGHLLNPIIFKLKGQLSFSVSFSGNWLARISHIRYGSRQRAPFWWQIRCKNCLLSNFTRPLQIHDIMMNSICKWKFR